MRSSHPRAKDDSTSREAQNLQFATDHLQADLAGRTVRGGAVTLATQGAKFLLQLGSTVILARLLAPRDFGLVAMATAVTGLAGIFKDVGLSTVTVQRDQINHRQLSTLFWINLVVGAALTLLVASLAPIAAWFYGRDELVGIFLVLSATYVFGGLTVQHQALLRRQMRFGTIAGIGVTSMACGIAAALVMVHLGAGYWALIGIPVASTLVNAALVWLFCPWRPGLPSRGCGIRSMLGFGGNLIGGDLLIYGYRNVDRVLIGAAWGAGALGLYSKSYQLLLAPATQINVPISAVMIPVLSRLQGQPARFRRAYRRAVGLSCCLGMPLVIFALVSTEDLIVLLLGSQWTGATPVFRALIPAGFVGTLSVAASWVLVPLGRTNRQLRCIAASSVVFVSAYLVGLPWGAVGVAASYSIAMVLIRVPQLAYSFHGTPIRLRDVGAAVARPATASLVAGAATWTATMSPTWPTLPAWRLAAGLVVYAASYLCLLTVLPGGRAWLAEMMSFRRALWRQNHSITQTTATT